MAVGREQGMKRMRMHLSMVGRQLSLDPCSLTAFIPVVGVTGQRQARIHSAGCYAGERLAPSLKGCSL